MRTWEVGTVYKRDGTYYLLLDDGIGEDKPLLISTELVPDCTVPKNRGSFGPPIPSHRKVGVFGFCLDSGRVRVVALSAIEEDLDDYLRVRGFHVAWLRKVWKVSSEEFDEIVLHYLKTNRFQEAARSRANCRKSPSRENSIMDQLIRLHRFRVP